MCCQRKGCISAAAACTAADTLSSAEATRMMRRSISSEATSVSATRGGRKNSSRAAEMPAFSGPNPKSGGTCRQEYRGMGPRLRFP